MTLKEMNKVLKEYEDEFGSSSCVFIPKLKTDWNVIKDNLSFTKEELRQHEKGLKSLKAEIKFYKKILELKRRKD